jgi:hypothetical protein
MCIPQRNFIEGNRSNESTEAKDDVDQSLVSLEMIFPPSFFNIMTHLLVHRVKEIVFSGLSSSIICFLLNDSLQS